MLGDHKLADDVQILDTTTEGVAGTVRPSRLSGTKLNMLNVRYYTLNDNGEIDRLILNDVTGDLWKYGVLDDVMISATLRPTCPPPRPLPLQGILRAKALMGPPRC